MNPHKTRLKQLLFLSLVISACTNKQNTLVPLDVNAQGVAPVTTSILIQNYKPQVGNTLKNIFVSNFSVIAKNGQLQYSTARDGLPDPTKLTLNSTYGFNTNSPESAVTGFPDLLVFKSGLTISKQNSLNCAPSQMGSSTGDWFQYSDYRQGGALTTIGLRDCDKLYIGLKPTSFDSNNNGIPDYLEMRCGMNPLSPIQSTLSAAGDGVSNLQKCRLNIPIDESASTSANQLYAYVYTNTNNPDGTTNISVTNIPVLNQAQDNMIAIFVVETNTTTKVSSLYTAFAILTSKYAGGLLKFPYWATGSANFLNQQISVP